MNVFRQGMSVHQRSGECAADYAQTASAPAVLPVVQSGGSAVIARYVIARLRVPRALLLQPPATQIEGLRQRSLDFSLVDTPPTDSEQDLEYIQVLDDRMLLALPQNHPLAQEENLVASQLGDEQWIAVIHNDDAHSRDHFVAACVNAGFNPDIRLEAGEPLPAHYDADYVELRPDLIPQRPDLMP